MESLDLKNIEVVLTDDIRLLDLMVRDSKSQPLKYQPGKYWAKKVEITVNDIKKYGLAGFRGSTDVIGLSYSDNLLLDIRKTMNYSIILRLIRLVLESFPLKRIFDSQVRWTESYAKESIAYAQEILNNKEKVNILLKKYSFPYSLSGKCESKAQIGGREYSIHYLNLLEQIDNISDLVDFSKVRSVVEIGGGFGANIHLLLENYKNIRKVLYIDIPPILYVGTQYLKAFYGNSVLDYSDLKTNDSIRFSSNDDLEILCIAPWQIEKFTDSVDLFMNSHSFVEMPAYVIKNYVDILNKLPGFEDAAIALATYDNFDLSTTLDPMLLPDFFNTRKFKFFEHEMLLLSSRKNLYFVSSGRLSNNDSPV